MWRKKRHVYAIKHKKERDEKNKYVDVRLKKTSLKHNIEYMRPLALDYIIEAAKKLCIRFSGRTRVISSLRWPLKKKIQKELKLQFSAAVS